MSGGRGRRRSGIGAESVLKLLNTVFEFVCALVGDTLVVGSVVVVVALAKRGRIFGGRSVGIGMPETFACRVEAVVDVAADGLACTMDGVDGTVNRAMGDEMERPWRRCQNMCGWCRDGWVE